MGAFWSFVKLVFYLFVIAIASFFVILLIPFAPWAALYLNILLVILGFSLIVRWIREVNPEAIDVLWNRTGLRNLFYICVLIAIIVVIFLFFYFIVSAVVGGLIGLLLFWQNEKYGFLKLSNRRFFTIALLLTVIFATLGALIFSPANYIAVGIIGFTFAYWLRLEK